jgi:hypothetical protein
MIVAEFCNTFVIASYNKYNVTLVGFDSTAVSAHVQIANS